MPTAALATGCVDHRLPLPLVAPALVFFVGFAVIPLVGVFVLSAGKSGKRAKGIGRGQEILVSYGKGFWAGRQSAAI